MLLYPWSLSLLFNSLRPIFLRRDNLSFNFYMWDTVLNQDNTAFVDLNKVCNHDGKENGWGRNPPEYHIDVLQILISKRKAYKGCSLQSDSGFNISILNSLWAIMMLLYAAHDLLLYLLLYHQTLIRQHAVRGTLLRKVKQKSKLLLFFISINQQFQSVELYSARNMTFLSPW